MKNRSRLAIFAMILSAVTCFGLLSGARAADGDLGGGNTNEGFRALNSLSGGGFNTGLGWYSLGFLTTGFYDTAVGAGALVLDNGGNNTAVGTAALLLNTTGVDNNAVGLDALLNNNGNFNNAHGRRALEANTTGIENEAFGDLALEVSVTGDGNTAVGDDALDSADGASFNTAVGKEACNTCTTGGDNVAIGHNALNGTSTANRNIAIGSVASGPFLDFDDTCFIGSIFGEPVSDPGTQTAVYVDQFNVVGIFSSSRRFKHDIQPMDKTSETLYRLKPVTFKFNSDWKATTQYGLIAEEVAEVNPGLVVRGKDGEVQTVRYEQINTMLLNEFLKEHKKVQDLEVTVAQQQKGMEVLTAQLKEQAAQIQKVSAQLEMSKPATKVAVENQ